MALAATTLALSAPVAAAAPAIAPVVGTSTQEEQGLASRGQSDPTPGALAPANPVAAVPAADDGFDWGSAGVGAAAAGALVVLTAAGLGAGRRVRVAR